MTSQPIPSGTWTLNLVSMEQEMTWWGIFVFIPCWSPTLFVFANPHVQRLDLSAQSGGPQIPPGHSSKDVSPCFEPYTAGRDTVAADLEPADAFSKHLRWGGGGAGVRRGSSRRGSVFVASHRGNSAVNCCCVLSLLEKEGLCDPFLFFFVCDPTAF